MRGQRKADAHIDLGLEISRMSLRPGETRTCAEMAYFTGTSRRSMEKLLEKAMCRVRPRLLELWKELES